MKDNNAIIIQNHLDELLNFPEIRKRRFIWHHPNARVCVDDACIVRRRTGRKINAFSEEEARDFIEERDRQNFIKDKTSREHARVIGIRCVSHRSVSREQGSRAKVEDNREAVESKYENRGTSEERRRFPWQLDVRSAREIIQSSQMQEEE